MKDWKAIFDDAANSGIHHVGPDVEYAELRKPAAALGFDFTLVDLRGAADKESFLGTVASALEFPDYFGTNWDALNDCLTDMSWKQATGYVLFFVGFQSFAEAAKAEATVAIRILGAAAEFWRQRGVSFYALLSD